MSQMSSNEGMTMTVMLILTHEKNFQWLFTGTFMTKTTIRPCHAVHTFQQILKANQNPFVQTELRCYHLHFCINKTFKALYKHCIIIIIIIIIIRPHSLNTLHKMQPIAKDVTRSMVCKLVTQIAVQKWLNRSRCQLDWLLLVQGTMY